MRILSICSVLLVASPSPAATPFARVHATVETPPAFDDDAGGNADSDDPAIWVHPWLPRASLVVATQKNAGLSVYALDGRALQHIPAPGRFNNVDLVHDFRLAGRRVDLAVVTDRGHD
jgi:3-phytase